MRAFTKASLMPITTATSLGDLPCRRPRGALAATEPRNGATLLLGSPLSPQALGRLTGWVLWRRLHSLVQRHARSSCRQRLITCNGQQQSRNRKGPLERSRVAPIIEKHVPQKAFSLCLVADDPQQPSVDWYAMPRK